MHLVKKRKKDAEQSVFFYSSIAVKNYGQVTKGYWWMPWHQKAKKDALPAIILGELDKSVDPRDSEWGNPAVQRLSSQSE